MKRRQPADEAWLPRHTMGVPLSSRVYAIVDGSSYRSTRRSAHHAEQAANAFVRGWMAAEERHQAPAAERLDDKHVRRGGVGVQGDSFRCGVNLPKRIRKPVRIAG